MPWVRGLEHKEKDLPEIRVKLRRERERRMRGKKRHLSQEDNFFGEP